MIMDTQYTTLAKAKLFSGDIVEVGLGEGLLSNELVKRHDVRSITHYERDPEVVARFRASSEKQTVIAEDIITANLTTSRFDVGVLDIFESIDAKHFDNARLIIPRLEQIMKPGGKIVIEYIADVPAERSFRRFMENRFGRMYVEFINTGIKGTSTGVAYYKVEVE